MSTVGWSVLLGVGVALSLLFVPLLGVMLPKMKRVKKGGAPTTVTDKKGLMPWMVGISVLTLVLIIVRGYGSGTQHNLSAVGPFLFFPAVLAWFTTVFGDLPEDRTIRTAQRTALATLLFVLLWHFKSEVAWLIATVGLSLGQHTDNETVVTVAQYGLVAVGLIVVYQGLLVGKVYKCTMAASVLLVMWYMVAT